MKNFLFDVLDKHFLPKNGELQTMKVPNVTIWFWIAKCCATTVGETVSDFFNLLFDPCQCTAKGLGYDALLFFPLLFLVLYWNFKLNYYSPVLYWGAIILCSICGTIVTDGFHDNLGLELWIEIVVFFFLMSWTFFAWFRSEGTLDIHSIDTFKRETYYWGTVIWTFALGTAVGDCTAESWGLAFGPILGFFAAISFFILMIWLLLRMTGKIEKGDQYEVTLFWSAYIMTRPLGASTGDLLGSSVKDGGVGLGVGYTSLLFFGIIVWIVLFLYYSKVDVLPPADHSTTVQVSHSLMTPNANDSRIYEVVKVGPGPEENVNCV
jgi:uncharacterized membrane-anchored protein